MIHLRDLVDVSLANNTVAIQDAMNKAAAQGVPLFVDAGQWKHTGLVVPSGLTMIGAGRVSEFYNTANNAHFDATSKTGFVLRDFAIRGNAAVDNTYAYPTVTNTGTGLKVSASSGFDVANLYITRVGVGIDYQANANWGAKGRFSNIDIDYVYKAVHTSASGEYANFHSILVDKSTFGLHIDSGNNIFSNCQVVRSGVALKLSGGTNNGHGQIVGCTFNHNNYNMDAYDAVSLGETIVGCHFIADIASPGSSGKLRITNSRGITLVGCQIGSNVTIDGGTGTQDGQNMIANCYIRDDITGWANPTYPNGGVALMKNNYNAAGLVAWNN